jgi:hypothetical protein
MTTKACEGEAFSHELVRLSLICVDAQHEHGEVAPAQEGKGSCSHERCSGLLSPLLTNSSELSTK